LFPAFGQSTSKYQVGTITEVKVHKTAGSGASDAASYDVSVKVGDTIYMVLYTPPLGEETVKYSAGRDLLVLVGKRTIRYNDILGQSFEVPIESQRPAGMMGFRCLGYCRSDWRQEWEQAMCAGSKSRGFAFWKIVRKASSVDKAARVGEANTPANIVQEGRET